MNDQNLDANLVIQSFQERINQLITEAVIKEATIKQLLAQLEELNNLKDIEKKDK